MNHKEAVEKRDKFLEKNPHMKEYQTELENILSKCKPEDRMEVLGIMLGCKLNEFSEQLLKLKDINENKIKGVHLKKSML